VATTFTLARGGGLVAFTDGLVERRGEDIDAGIGGVLSAVDPAAGLDDAWKVLYRVVEAAPGEGQDDDVTVLSLYRH
jgi:hypothetical protein